MDTQTQDAGGATPTKTIAQIAQELLGSSTSTADERRLAAWVLDHDEHAEVALASQARLTARLDAQAQRARQRATAAGGDVVKRLAGVAEAPVEHAADATGDHTTDQGEQH